MCVRCVPSPTAAPEPVVDEANVDYTKMTVKALRQLLAKRGVSCDGCIEKSDFVKKAEATKGVKVTEL